MDITGIDIAAIGGLVTSMGAVVKSLLSDRKTKAIEDDRVESNRGINERFAVIEERLRHSDKRLDDGDAAFKTLDSKMDRTNELLNQLIGEVRATRK